MGPKSLQVPRGRFPEEFVLSLDMPVYLEVRRRGMVGGDEGWAEVATEDGQGLG